MTQLDRLRRALLIGGRATVTVRSARTGEHVTVDLVCRKRDETGRWASRSGKSGRVGVLDADVVEARDPMRPHDRAYVGRLYLSSGRWAAGKDADPARAWVADRVITAARTGIPIMHEMFVADRCCVCGRRMTDPESLARGVGPECWGGATGSKMARSA